MDAFILQKPTAQTTPLIVDVPHAGRKFPGDFKNALPQKELRKWEDAWVDELAADAPLLHIPLLSAQVHRTYVDLNRHMMDVHPEAVKQELEAAALHPSDRTLRTGNGLIKRIGPNGKDVHKKALSADELEHRISTYYVPYHTALGNLLEETVRRFGVAYHLNLHAMFSRVGEDGPNRPDFVLSDNHGKTCDPAFTNFVKGVLTEMGHSVQVNDPFEGGEIVQMYGRPGHGVHSLQIEISKALYMDETALKKHEGFDKTRHLIRTLLERVARWSADQVTAGNVRPLREDEVRVSI